MVYNKLVNFFLQEWIFCRRDKYSSYNEAQYKRCIDQCFQEIIFLNRLKSEFIIPILAYSENPDPCIVYQFMPNGSLLDRWGEEQGDFLK